MSPECLYWVALFALVLPSVPFNKTALVVLAVWAFGHFTYRIGGYDDAACMFARIIATGAALALSKPWDGSRRALCSIAVALLFIPAAALSAINAIYFYSPPATMTEYYWQTVTYWSLWAVIIVQAVIVPAGNDWSNLRKIDDWIMRQIVKRFGGVA